MFLFVLSFAIIGLFAYLGNQQRKPARGGMVKPSLNNDSGYEFENMMTDPAYSNVPGNALCEEQHHDEARIGW